MVHKYRGNSGLCCLYSLYRSRQLGIQIGKDNHELIALLRLKQRSANIHRNELQRSVIDKQMEVLQLRVMRSARRRT